MNDNTTPSESPEDLGNTVDGTRAGDGGDARTEPDERDPGEQGPGGQSPADGPEQSLEHSSGPTSGHKHAARERAEQQQVYHTPEQPDQALGGSEGTTDGS